MIVRSTLEIAEQDWLEFVADCRSHRVVIDSSSPILIDASSVWSSYCGPKRIPGYIVTAHKEIPEGPVTAPVVGPELVYVIQRYIRGFASTNELLATFARYGVTPSPKLVGQFHCGLLTSRDYGNEFIYQNREWIQSNVR